MCTFFNTLPYRFLNSQSNKCGCRCRISSITQSKLVLRYKHLQIDNPRRSKNLKIKNGTFIAENPALGGRPDSNRRPSVPQTDALTN